MQVNWNLVFNILLLIGVLVGIQRLMFARHRTLKASKMVKGRVLRPVEPPLEKSCDEIIAVRKVVPSVHLAPEKDATASMSSDSEFDPQNHSGPSIMMFLHAKETRQFAGYELLQTLLAAGLRFGEGQVFHRHQHTNGQGPVLCSLAAATDSGLFDLHNMGAFQTRGLCLYMHASGNAAIDMERFVIMHQTAKQLQEGLDAYLLDDRQKIFNETSLIRYHHRLNHQKTNNESIPS